MTENNQTATLEQTDTPIIVYISTFPPRKCGITEDLVKAMDEMLAPMVQSKVTAMNPSHVHSYNYPRKVLFQIHQDNQQEYIEIAKQINRMDSVHLVSIQHEFGIFGGERGSYLVPFVKALEKPVVITFHTVLPNPNKRIFNIVSSLAENAKAITVMTEHSKGVLVQDYRLSARKIHVIPHGIHSRPFTPSQQAKMALGYSDRVVLSTFGLLGRNKGLEYVIDALPEVLKRNPNFVYIIFGATHPVILEKEGESYRNFLISKIYDLQLYDNVKLYNKYFALNELLHFLKATDIYISPSLNPNQAVSGTLSYALGMGRPVISTAFSQAKEIITEDVGILVDFKSPQSYASAILHLLEDEDLRMQLGRNAYFQTRYMTWPNVALKYAIVFSRQARGLKGIHRIRSLPEVKLDHLMRLTDDFGIIQFAKLSKRDISSGYTLDDNARALVAVALHYKKLGKSTKRPIEAVYKSKLLKLASTYLEFITFAASADHYFYHYINPDRTPNYNQNQQDNLEESYARAFYALAFSTTVGSLPRHIRQKALTILIDKMHKHVSFNSPRAVAHHIKTLHLLLSKHIEIAKVDLKSELKNQCDRLIHLYEITHSTDWLWFEEYLAYSNSILSEALLLGYQITLNEAYLRIGKSTLDFLIDNSFHNDLFLPAGQNSWHQRNGIHSKFDQQPEEVTSMVYALETCYSITRDEHYSELIYQAFYWFLGVNSLNQVVYDRTTGGCYDGVSKKTINLNQGAESTIAYLMARLAFE
jgi:glycosyltransferase involved in cell wall biosynthesis